jgi:GNAT superfamily N-acetyltransferase
MPAPRRLSLELRPATLEDAELVADLDSTFDPEDPRDPEKLRFRWRRREEDQITVRLVAEVDGRAVAFVGAGHDRWSENPKRYGWLQPRLLRDLWSETEFARLVGEAESWLRAKGGAIGVTRVREDFRNEMGALGRLGYTEVRRQNMSELDLVAGAERLVDTARHLRQLMHDQGVALLTLDRDADPESLLKLYDMTIAAEKDIPITIPWRIETFEEWQRWWFDNPGVRKDRFWIAREGDAIIGLSVLDFPATRGLPWTAFTGTVQRVRGRGVARALKYESVAQAVGLGYDRVRTMNDRANAPILHINGEMGYRLVVPMVELHRELSS